MANDSKLNPLLKILCVDDEPEVLKQMSASVNTLGFIALTASSVDEAVRILQAESGRLVLVVSDYSMPSGTGFDLRKEMLKEHRAIPFVLVSGHITREDALKGVELKIAAFLEKPFRQNDLLQVIQDESKERIAAIREDDELLGGFVTEAAALTEEMEGLILFLEEEPDNIDTVNRIFACAHTIKGSSGFFKPDTVHRFTHRYEDFLSKLKSDPKQVDSGAISILLKGLDIIKQQIVLLENRSSEAVSLESLLSIFDQKKPAAAVENSPRPGKSNSASASSEVKEKAQPKQSEEIRVSIALLDDFMENSGEITVLRNMVNKVLRMIELEKPSDPTVTMLSELLSEMHKVNSSMQERLTDLRKVPMKQVFRPLSRTLRDLCVSLKKKIAFETRGDELRIDHIMAETLSKCLIHMLRNSADHGIESPEERASKGKPQSGSIRLSCEESADLITIRITDDGRGIDPARIRIKAVEKGVVSAAEAAAMSDGEARMLIFEPGFSTAEQITDVSGRGVGTDMVKQTILAAGGQIALNSEVGMGTEFVIRLPVPRSVLIISSLMVRVAGHAFAIPQEKIIRVVRLDREAILQRIRNIGESRFFSEKESLVPVVSLDELLDGDAKHKRSDEGSEMVWLRCAGGDYCLEVDEILDIEEIVVKPQASWFSQVGCYAGATFLGDGKIGLILDPEGVGRRAGISEKRGTKALPIQTSARTGASERSESLGSTLALLFRLGTKTQYAINQEEIFRLEQIRAKEIKRSGNQSIVVYRDHSMPLFPLGTILEGSTHCPSEQSERGEELLPMVVLSHRGRFMAFLVREFGDFVAYDETTDSSLSFGEFTKTRIIGNQAVTLVDLRGVLDRANLASHPIAA